MTNELPMINADPSARSGEGEAGAQLLHRRL